LYALQDPAVQISVPPAKATLPDPAVQAVSPVKDASPNLSTAEQAAQDSRFLPVLGQIVILNSGILDLGLDPQQVEQLLYGERVTLNGGKLLELEPKEEEVLHQYLKKLNEAHIAKTKKRNEAFLAEKQKEPGIQKTASGSLYKTTKLGDSVHATQDCMIKMNLEVKSIDGETLEREENESIWGGTLPSDLFEVIKLFGQGGEGQAFILSDQVYGDGSVLIFDFKIHEITQPMWENEELTEKEMPKKEEPKVDVKAPSK
jgi:hypothetical protein